MQNLKQSISNLGFPCGATGIEPTCQCRRRKRGGFNPWVGKISQRRALQRNPVFLIGESHGQRSLAGYSPQDFKESNQLKQLSISNLNLKQSIRKGQSSKQNFFWLIKHTFRKYTMWCSIRRILSKITNEMNIHSIPSSLKYYAIVLASSLVNKKVIKCKKFSKFCLIFADNLVVNIEKQRKSTYY